MHSLSSTGVVGTARREGPVRNVGGPAGCGDADRNAGSTEAVRLGVGEAHSTVEAGESRRREGASLLEGFGRGEGEGDWR